VPSNHSSSIFKNNPGYIGRVADCQLPGL
jgi:hypothetical protein